MSSFAVDHDRFWGTATLSIADEERGRVSVLRERLAQFWATSEGEPRAVYDAFVGVTPVCDDVTMSPVRDAAGQGWWIQPQAVQTGAAVLFLHGGGYVQGSATAYRGFASQIVSRSGVPALVIDYPLAPEATLPAAHEAALAAWDWLIEQGFDRVAIVGDSAGGGLALATLASLVRQQRHPRPAAGVVFSPWTDLTLSGSSMNDPSIEDPLISRDDLQDCAGKYVGSSSVTDPLASPLLGDLAGLPPLLIQVGTDECLLDDATRYAARATDAGVRVRLEVWEGLHHVFQLHVSDLQSSRDALDRAALFLRRALQS